MEEYCNWVSYNVNNEEQHRVTSSNVAVKIRYPITLIILITISIFKLFCRKNLEFHLKE